MLLNYEIEKKYQLRDYQAKGVHETLQSMASNHSTMFQLPTGGGKTLCMIDIMRRCVLNNYRCMLLAHRKELIDQGRDKLYSMTNIVSGMIMGNHTTDYSLPVQIGSIQTLKNRNLPKKIKVLLIDEAHHATANTYRKIINKYPNAYLLGVTATPIRTNGKGFGDIFNDMVLGPSIKWMEQQGYLCEAFIPEIFINRSLAVGLKDLATQKGGLTGGDYNQKRLSQLLKQAKVSTDVVHSKIEFAEGKKTITFALDVENSKDIVKRYLRFGIKAQHLDGTTHSLDRTRIINEFSDPNSDLEVLSNVGIATEGTDIPCTECIQLARPTKSLSLYLQMVGRGSRLFEGKSKYILLDLAGNIFEHGKPNKRREWTLEGTNKYDISHSYKKFVVTYQDGRKEVLDSRSIPLGVNRLKIKTIEDLEQEFRREEIDRLFTVAQRKGLKAGWVYYSFRNAVDYSISDIEYEYLAKTLKYSQGWIKHAKSKDKAEIANR